MRGCSDVQANDRSAIHCALTPARRPLRFQLPSDVKRIGADLFNQQMWCWGSDIRRAEGNLLNAYGFSKHAAPEGSGLKPCYSMDMGGGSTVGLWGFGMYMADARYGGMFLKRFGFSPRLLSPEEVSFDVWVMRDMPEIRLAESGAECHMLQQLLGLALDWMAGYEAWVVSRAGTDYRASTVNAWRAMHKPVAVEGPMMEDAWRILARRCRDVVPVAGLAG
jgi:hypothetical protein